MYLFSGDGSCVICFLHVINILYYFSTNCWLQWWIVHDLLLEVVLAVAMRSSRHQVSLCARRCFLPVLTSGSHCPLFTFTSNMEDEVDVDIEGDEFENNIR